MAMKCSVMEQNAEREKVTVANCGGKNRIQYAHPHWKVPADPKTAGFTPVFWVLDGAFSQAVRWLFATAEGWGCKKEWSSNKWMQWLLASVRRSWTYIYIYILLCRISTPLSVFLQLSFAVRKRAACRRQDPQATFHFAAKGQSRSNVQFCWSEKFKIMKESTRASCASAHELTYLIYLRLPEYTTACSS